MAARSNGKTSVESYVATTWLFRLLEKDVLDLGLVERAKDARDVGEGRVDRGEEGDAADVLNLVDRARGEVGEGAVERGQVGLLSGLLQRLGDAAGYSEIVSLALA